jgi:hypothetical protein
LDAKWVIPKGTTLKWVKVKRAKNKMAKSSRTHAAFLDSLASLRYLRGLRIGSGNSEKRPDVPSSTAPAFCSCSGEIDGLDDPLLLAFASAAALSLASTARLEASKASYTAR